MTNQISNILGMTTNGLVLRDKLDSLIEAGLTSVNISLGTTTT